MSAAGLSEGDEIIATINVTPLVDIMLVLLIIFMLTTSMMEYPTVQVELPKAENQEEAPSKTLAMVVDNEGRVYINGREVTLDQAKSVLESEVRSNSDLILMLAGDGRVKYQSIMEVVDLVKNLGIRHLSLNVEFSANRRGRQ